MGDTAQAKKKRPVWIKKKKKSLYIQDFLKKIQQSHSEVNHMEYLVDWAVGAMHACLTVHAITVKYE